MRLIPASALAAVLVLANANAADPAPDTPLVKRGNIVITADDFNAGLLTRIPQDRREEFRGSSERIQQMASALYLARSLAERARAEGIDKDPEIRKRLQLQEENVLADAYMQRFEKSIKAPDFETRAKELYAADIARYKTPERVKFHYVMVDTSGRTKEEARRRAEEAHAKLAAGEPMGKIVREYSNEPSARANGGEWGPLGYTDAGVPAAVSDMLRKLKVGELSPVVEVGDSFHIVRVDERYRAKVTPFEEAKREIIENEQFKYRRVIIDKMLGEITNSKDIVIYTDNIAKLRHEVDLEAVRRQHEEAAKKLAGERLP